MEMWERLAYYGMRVVVPIYIAQADEPGGLHFTQMEKGSIYAWWFVFQSVLPTFTGGYAEDGFFGFDFQFEGDTEAAPELAVAGGILSELVPAEQQRKPRFHDLDGAEFQSATTGEFPDIGPAVTVA